MAFYIKEILKDDFPVNSDYAVEKNEYSNNLKSAKDFYEYYQIHFLEIGNNVIEKNNMEHLIALEMIKDYVKYYNGIKKIEETLVNFKKKEEEN